MSLDWSLEKSRWPSSPHHVGELGRKLLPRIVGYLGIARLSDFCKHAIFAVALAVAPLPAPPSLTFVLRGLQVVESACAIPTTLMGEKIEVSKDTDTETGDAQGAVGGFIASFNFPAAAINAGSSPSRSSRVTAIKPSEHDPHATMIIAEQCVRASAGTKNGKRVQSVKGKNHAVFMPDTNRDQGLNALMGTACSAAGQRYMAISPSSSARRKRSYPRQVNLGFEKGTQLLGPVTTPALVRIEGLIASADNAGAKKILLDGRGVHVPGYPRGTGSAQRSLRIPPSLPRHIPPFCLPRGIAREELFTPVLCVLSVPTLDAAIAILTAKPFGNGAAIFTQSGPIARKFETEASFLGDINFYGKGGINFYMQIKTTTTLWQSDDSYVHGEGEGGGASVNMLVLE
ncbi:Aldehyde/histidinol dehydrogenase [Mycena galopus ATCC 62051]|nr:Aldehyde/histidinol dehydrogenase [Mycena galopus ATCC 62051]